ncbi:MAG: hypothetical protein NUV50_06100 [Rhodospirillales bacterium]|nr:hypothetical protein [Rhodospirillales bacterium]
MADQEQSVGNNSFVVQSGGSTNIQAGVGPEEMRQIIGTLAEFHKQFTEIAMGTVEQRMKDFENRLVDKFSVLENANSEAFKDPDFQYVLRRAQMGYARCGDVDVAETIVDVIAERSKATDRNRLQMTLNEAVEIAGSLTANEFAELSLVFMIKNTQDLSVGNFTLFANYLRAKILPLLHDVSRSVSSYKFLEAQRCATIQLTSVDLGQWLRQSYGGIFSKGFTAEDLMNHLPEEKKGILEGAKRNDGQSLIIPCLNDKSKFQFARRNKIELLQELEAFDLNKDQREVLGNLYEGTFMNLAEAREIIDPVIPEFEELVHVWNHTPLKQLDLTSIGIAIAHSKMRSMSGFNADLSIWID